MSIADIDDPDAKELIRYERH